MANGLKRGKPIQIHCLCPHSSSKFNLHDTLTLQFPAPVPSPDSILTLQCTLHNGDGGIDTRPSRPSLAYRAGKIAFPACMHGYPPSFKSDMPLSIAASPSLTLLFRSRIVTPAGGLAIETSFWSLGLIKARRQATESRTRCVVLLKDEGAVLSGLRLFHLISLANEHQTRAEPEKTAMQNKQRPTPSKTGSLWCVSLG